MKMAHVLCLTYTISFGCLVSIQNSLATGIMKLLQTQSCNVHMFTSNAAVLPAATSSTAHQPPSCRCHYSQCSVITADAGRICDCITVYPQSSTHQSAMSPKKTHVQELKEKCVVLTENGNMQKTRKRRNCVYVRVFLMQQADSCNQNVLFPIPAR
jgi:hypothetical protein